MAGLDAHGGDLLLTIQRISKPPTTQAPSLNPTTESSLRLSTLDSTSPVKPVKTVSIVEADKHMYLCTFFLFV